MIRPTLGARHTWCGPGRYGSGTPESAGFADLYAPRDHSVCNASGHVEDATLNTLG